MSVVALSDKIVVDDSQGLLDEYRSISTILFL